MGAGRPAGAKNKLPSRIQINNELEKRNFNVFDELILQFKHTDNELVRFQISKLFFEYTFSKPRQEDADGKPEEGQTVIVYKVTDEQLDVLNDKARKLK